MIKRSTVLCQSPVYRCFGQYWYCGTLHLIQHNGCTTFWGNIMTYCVSSFLQCLKFYDISVLNRDSWQCINKRLLLLRDLGCPVAGSLALLSRLYVVSSSVRCRYKRCSAALPCIPVIWSSVLFLHNFWIVVSEFFSFLCMDCSSYINLPLS